MTGSALFGPMAAILVMAVVTYLCRISGYVLMGLVPLTPRLQRGLKALPGCIVVATVLPIAARSGPVAFAGIAAALAIMAWRRNELLALLTGLATVAGLRAAGL